MDAPFFFLMALPPSSIRLASSSASSRLLLPENSPPWSLLTLDIMISCWAKDSCAARKAPPLSLFNFSRQQALNLVNWSVTSSLVAHVAHFTSAPFGADVWIAFYLHFFDRFLLKLCPRPSCQRLQSLAEKKAEPSSSFVNRRRRNVVAENYAHSFCFIWFDHFV